MTVEVERDGSRVASGPPADLQLARCPACRLALGAAIGPCPRCASELDLVRAAYAWAWIEVERSRGAARAGDLTGAQEAAWRAVALVRTASTEEQLARVGGSAPPSR